MPASGRTQSAVTGKRMVIADAPEEHYAAMPSSIR
jgi:hypothetical protein